MGKVGQLVKVVRHASQLPDAVRLLVRKPCNIVSLDSHLIDDGGQRHTFLLADTAQLVVVRPVEANLHGTVSPLPIRKGRSAAFVGSGSLFCHISVTLCFGGFVHKSVVCDWQARLYQPRFIGTKNLYLLPKHLNPINPQWQSHPQHKKMP